MDTELLTAAVRERAPDSSDPLALLETALAVAAEAGQAADALVEHHVGAARAAGCSWTVIGERLGVSKQAARERYMHRLPVADPAAEVTMIPRLAACVEVAKVAAAAEDSAPGTQHLLLGLLHAGPAATILDRCGVTREKVRSAGARLFEPVVLDERRIVGDGEADTALSSAQRLACQAGHRHVGTEHVLFVIALDAGSSAHRVLFDIGVDPAHIKKELAQTMPPQPRARRRRGKADDTGRGCSFCGNADPGRPKVAGPGVVICEECIRLSADILRDRQAGTA